MAKFEGAIEIVLMNEGGYSNDPDDRGGATKYGITEHLYKSIGLPGTVADLSLQDAVEIYKKHFWNPHQYKNIDSQYIANKIFDLSVNMGYIAAGKVAQRAVRAANGFKLDDDGIIGKKTLEQINGIKPNTLLPAIRSEAACHYRSLTHLKGFTKFINGWLNRAYS